MQSLEDVLSDICGKELMVFDAPTSGLDLKSMEEVGTLTRSLATQGKVLLIITHDIEFMMRICTRILFIRYGDIVKDLSGGQKRRVAIAGVLAMKPEVLILDEPTAGLDPAGRDEILDLIARMHKEKGITVILVSHSMEDVAKYVERIIVMNHGQVMFDNTPCEVFKHYKELEQIGLAAPQVTYLMHELKEKGLNVNTEATTVAEARESLLEVLLGREPNHRGSNLEEENLC